jgi:hypothetical protein
MARPVDSPTGPAVLSGVRALELPVLVLHYHQIRGRRSRDGPTVFTPC